MSSEQFSEKPLPAGKKRCPYCGEVLAASDEQCWLCLEKVSVKEGEPRPRARTAPAAADGDNATWAVFAALTIVMVGGMALAAPGVLIVLLILAVPAMIRAVAVSSRTPDLEIARSPNFALLFLNSL